MLWGIFLHDLLTQARMIVLLVYNPMWFHKTVLVFTTNNAESGVGKQNKNGNPVTE